MNHPETIKQLNMICLGLLMLIIGLGIALYALQRLGPEPEIGAADYKQMQCQYMPDAPECRVKKVQIAGK